MIGTSWIAGWSRCCLGSEALIRAWRIAAEEAQRRVVQLVLGLNGSAALLQPDPPYSPPGDHWRVFASSRIRPDGDRQASAELALKIAPAHSTL